MSDSLPSICFVVPTKDRPAELRTMLRSLAAQDAGPAQVVVVDSSSASNAGIEQEFPGLHVEYVRHQGKPSAAGQRNVGATRVRPDVDLVCFFDDDQVLLKGSLHEMLLFWSRAGEGVAGAGFNLVNEIDYRPSLLKRSRLTEWLGLYSRTPGSVAKSGWQVLPGRVDTDMEVEWLTTGAVVWQQSVLETIKFDEYFDGYSYLEDLEFSYSVSRKSRLVIVGASHVHHFPSPRGRIGMGQFGRVEVRNRLYFVRKHGLSVGRCYVALGIRFLMSLGLGILMPWKGGLFRAWGNLAGIARYGLPGKTGARD